MGAPSSGRLIRAIEHDFAAPILIGGGVVVALLWSAVSASTYQRITGEVWSSPSWDFSSVNSVHLLVVNGLMTLFFLAIGLELSREIRTGSLTRPAHALPPVLGALGGMAGTALLSLLLGALADSSALRRGWGVPMATDIAFTLGVVALVGRRLPPQVRLFLLTLAIADDAFAVIVLAFTGASHVRGAGIVALIVMMSVAGSTSRRVRQPWIGITLIVAIWVCFVWANVEPPLAGVAGGLVVWFDETTALRLERRLSRWSTGVVLPLFALVSCGVHWRVLSMRSEVLTIIVAMVVIRIVGKVVGITGGVAVSALLGFRLHPSISRRILVGAAALCAIGFTVPLLFADRLFGRQSPAYGAVTIGLLASSLIAAIVGVAFLRIETRSK